MAFSNPVDERLAAIERTLVRLVADVESIKDDLAKLDGGHCQNFDSINWLKHRVLRLQERVIDNPLERE